MNLQQKSALKCSKKYSLKGSVCGSDGRELLQTLESRSSNPVISKFYLL